MLNVLIPLAGKNSLFPEANYPYPKPLIEINGRTMVQRALESIDVINGDKQYIFIVDSSECKKFHLDSTLRLLAGDAAIIIKIEKETKGAACSALMAIDYINTDDPLLICNADQVFECDLNGKVRELMKGDAGIITFESVHPRWSYAALDLNGAVIQTAEKNPISKHAIAGLYFFKRGADFVRAATTMISKGADVNGSYYIAPVLNELVLLNMEIRSIPVKIEQYKSFYSPAKIAEYERESAFKSQ